VWYLSQRW